MSSVATRYPPSTTKAMMVANTMLLGRIRLGFHLGRFGGLLSAVAAGFRLSVRLLRSSSSLTIFLMDEIPCFTEVADYASPLAGNLLIVGTDQFGETVSPQRPIEDFAAILTIRFPVLSPTFEAISGPHVFGSRVSGFTATLKAANPTVIATA